MKIPNHVDFVKRQVEVHGRKMGQNGQLSRDATRHKWLHDEFSALLQAMQDDIEESVSAGARAVGDDVPGRQALSAVDLDTLLSSPTQLQPGQLAGLPPELLDQLQISDVEKFQWTVLDIINRTPEKTISLEVLLIALYHQTKKVYERTDLSNRIYRMARKSLVFSVPGKKGWYSTVKQDHQASIDLSNEDEEEEANGEDML